MPKYAGEITLIGLIDKIILHAICDMNTFSATIALAQTKVHNLYERIAKATDSETKKILGYIHEAKYHTDMAGQASILSASISNEAKDIVNAVEDQEWVIMEKMEEAQEKVVEFNSSTQDKIAKSFRDAIANDLQLIFVLQRFNEIMAKAVQYEMTNIKTPSCD